MEGDKDSLLLVEFEEDERNGIFPPAACSLMTSNTVFLVGLALVIVAGSTAYAWTSEAVEPQGTAPHDPVSSATAGPAPAEGAPGSVHAVPWKGYVRAGPADHFAHTRETEGAMAPLARMGFHVDVPAGTEALQFRLAWEEGEKMHIMAHAPEAKGEMPTFMSGWPESGEACFAIPATHLRPGVWNVMAHAESTTVELEFVITVESVSQVAPIILDEAHGHAFGERMDMPMKEPLSCANL